MTGTTMHDSPPRERAAEAKDVAVERTGAVAATAKEQAGEVVAQAKAQTANLAGQVRGSLQDQSRGQRDRLVGTLHTFAEDLDRMVGGADSDGPAAQLVRQVSTRAHDVASSLESREPGELLDGVRDFARRRPGTFLLGAALVGVIAGRATRSARAAQQQRSTDQSYDTTPQFASTGTPSTVGASATPIGDSAQAAVLAGDVDPTYQPSPTGAATGGTMWSAAEEEPTLGPTNYGAPTGGDVQRAVDLREVTGERSLAPVPENSPDDGYGEVLEPDGSGHRSPE